MARRCVWDKTEAEALACPDRIVRRVKNIGILADVLALEPALGRERLVALLKAMPAGGMRPRSWWSWHYRLGLADAALDPPSMPKRIVG